MTAQNLIENGTITFKDFERFLHYYDIKEAAYYAEPPEEIHNNIYGKILSQSEQQTFSIWYPEFKGNSDIDTNPMLPFELLYLKFVLAY